MSFTPGPWWHAECRTEGYAVTSKTNLVCAAQDEYGHYGSVKSIHDARLIAAAPELLEALELAAETLRRYEGYHRAKQTQESLDKAIANQQLAMRFEAVIAKARGEGV